MKKILVKNGKVVFEDGVKKTELLIAGNKISKIGGGENYDEVIDAEGHYVLPGLIDLHYHGLLMFPVPEKIAEFLTRMLKMLFLRGVAGILATFPATPLPRLIECLIALKEFWTQRKPRGDEELEARLLGVHLEGPFLNKEAKGAQPEEAIVDYDPDCGEMAKLFEVGRGVVKLMTFAPERKGARELLAVLKKENIIPAIGHSVASFEEAEEFCELGANYLTHLFNGMRGVHHRTPGLALAGLVEERFFREIIVDGYHLHPAIINLVWKNSPKGKLLLVTDFVGDEEPLDEEPPRLASGALAGSRLRLMVAVRNLIKFTGASVAEAVASASVYPARLLGLTHLGKIEEGFESFLVLADGNFGLKKIIHYERAIELGEIFRG